MIDAKILAACMQSRKAYERVAPYLSDKDLSPQGQYWWGYIVSWYQRDPTALAVDRDILGAEGARELTLAKHRETLVGYYKDLPTVPSAYNVAQEVLGLKRRNKELEYAAALASGVNDLDKRRKLHNELGELLEATDLGVASFEYANDNDKMFEVTSYANRLPIAPAKLTERTCGGVTAGDHIVIFGRPEAGKSLVAVNMAAGFLRQGKTVLYLGNEENIYKARRRITCNLAGMRDLHFEKEKALGIQRATAKGLGLLNTARADLLEQVRAMVDDCKPQILILDQIRNLEYVGEESLSMTNKLAKLAVDVRKLLAKYGAVGISVTQAGDKTERYGQEPPIWLTMSDVDSSRTGLPAQADLLVGVGVNGEIADRNERAISIPKNKLGNSHEGFLVNVDLERSIVK